MIVRMHDGIYNDIVNMQGHKISYLAALQHIQKTCIAFTTSSLPLSQGDFKITEQHSATREFAGTVDNPPANY